MNILSPSLLAAGFTNLEKEIETITNGGVNGHKYYKRKGWISNTIGQTRRCSKLFITKENNQYYFYFPEAGEICITESGKGKTICGFNGNEK